MDEDKILQSNFITLAKDAHAHIETNKEHKRTTIEPSSYTFLKAVRENTVSVKSNQRKKNLIFNANK